jgi:hypothetical protein
MALADQQSHQLAASASIIARHLEPPPGISSFCWRGRRPLSAPQNPPIILAACQTRTGALTAASTCRHSRPAAPSAATPSTKPAAATSPSAAESVPYGGHALGPALGCGLSRGVRRESPYKAELLAYSMLNVEDSLPARVRLRSIPITPGRVIGLRAPNEKQGPVVC